MNKPVYLGYDIPAIMRVGLSRLYAAIGCNVLAVLFAVRRSPPGSSNGPGVSGTLASYVSTAPAISSKNLANLPGIEAIWEQL